MSQVKAVLENWKKLKQDVSKYVAQKNIEVEGNLKRILTSTTKLTARFDTDVKKIKTLFLKEKKLLEKALNQAITQEIKKAQKFVSVQRKEIHNIQKKIEKFQLKPTKKTAKKKTVKRTTKKAASK